MQNLAIAASLAAGVTGTALASVNFNGSYFQDFNGLGTSGAETITGTGPHAINGILGATGMDGWYGANVGGSSSNTEFKAHNGSLAGSAGRGVVSFGMDGSNERALGALSTSNQVNAFGIVLFNNTSDTFQSLDISFFGEQWRAGDADLFNTLTFSYGFGTSLADATNSFSSLDFLTPNLSGGEIAIDGNAPENRTALGDTITGLNWAPGQSLVLRWDAIDLSGQDNGLAIDDLTLTGVIPAPGVLALIGLAGLAGGRRRRA